jgi:hypothetical protein
MKPDKATCPECDCTFVVTRYGHRIPCPNCDEALDILPDADGFSRKYWRHAIRGKIVWLLGLVKELEELALGTPAMRKQLAAEAEKLRMFLRAKE